MLYICFILRQHIAVTKSTTNFNTIILMLDKMLKVKWEVCKMRKIQILQVFKSVEVTLKYKFIKKNFLYKTDGTIKICKNTEEKSNFPNISKIILSFLMLSHLTDIKMTVCCTDLMFLPHQKCILLNQSLCH